MKKIALILVAVLLFSVLSVPVAAENEKPLAGTVINVYNWGQYLSDGSDGSLDINALFEEKTGIHVNYITFDSNETLYSKLKTGGVSIDVIIPSDYMVARLIDEGMVQKIDFANIPNYQYIDEEFKNQDYDPANAYSVPYTWGTVGIIYNSKYVTEEVDSWSILWDEKYAGKVLMFDNPRDAFAVAELYKGYSINTTDPEELNACKELLAQETPILQGYVMDQIYESMQNEEAWIAPYYAGDYLQMAVDNEDLKFCHPKEGFNLFIDAFCVPTCAQNKAGAEAYINFLCDPEIAGPNLDYLGYSTPETEAKQYMDPETVESPVAYPSEEVLQRGSAFSNLPEETLQLMDSLWLEVKSSDTSSVYLIIAIVAVVIIVAAILVFALRKKATQKRRRNRNNVNK